MNTYWQIIDAQLDTIEREGTNTYDGLVAIMPGDPGMSAASAFFGGSGGDRSLCSALSVAGWRITWSEASYHYTAQHPDTGEMITYCEGDIYRGTHR